MILGDFFKAVAQLGDSRFQRVVMLGIGLTIALLVAIYAGFLMLIDWADPSALTLPGVGQVTWLGDLLSWGSLILMIVASMFLMVPVASAMTSLFLDDVADAVARYARRYRQPRENPTRVVIRIAVERAMGSRGLVAPAG